MFQAGVEHHPLQRGVCPSHSATQTFLLKPRGRLSTTERKVSCVQKAILGRQSGSYWSKESQLTCDSPSSGPDGFLQGKQNLLHPSLSPNLLRYYPLREVLHGAEASSFSFLHRLVEPLISSCHLHRGRSLPPSVVLLRSSLTFEHLKHHLFKLRLKQPLCHFKYLKTYISRIHSTAAFKCVMHLHQKPQLTTFLWTDLWKRWPSCFTVVLMVPNAHLFPTLTGSFCVWI